MTLNELKILIETNQVKDIRLTAIESDSGCTYDLYITTSSTKLDGKLRTGRTHQNKVYSSLDRATKSMRALGYKGGFTISFEDVLKIPTERPIDIIDCDEISKG